MINIKINYQNPSVKKEHLGFGQSEVPRNTALKMRNIVKESSYNPYVRKWAEIIINDLDDRDEWGEVEAIFYFVRDYIRYVKDPKGMEYIQTPPYMLKTIEMEQKAAGDCDDQTVLTLSLLKSIGYRVAIRVTGYKPGKYSHVYGLVNIKNKWIPIDTVRKDKELGWEARGYQVMDLEVK